MPTRESWRRDAETQLRPVQRLLFRFSGACLVAIVAHSAATHVGLAFCGLSRPLTRSTTGRGRHIQAPHSVVRPLKVVPADYSYTAWEWMSNLGTPAALVAGAALASCLELRESLFERKQGERRRAKILKKLTLLLFLSSFVLEISVVFIGTVTGTMLLASSDPAAKSLPARVNAAAYSATGMMHREMEFEYLALRLFFFQGLLNWLAAVGINLWVPIAAETSDADGRAVRNLRLAAAYGIAATILLMVAFYDYHLAFYGSYMSMWTRFVHLAVRRFLLCWPPRPLPVAAIACCGAALRHAISAFSASFGSNPGGSGVPVAGASKPAA